MIALFIIWSGFKATDQDNEYDEIADEVNQQQ